MGRYDEPSVILSGGPVRVNVSDPDPEYSPRPVGFLATLAGGDADPDPPAVEPEPEDPWRTWDGDQA